MIHLKKLSRRNFIRNTAAGALGAATAAVLTSCGSSASSAASSTAASGVSVFKPGTYTASATGMDKVTVSLTFSENAITDVSVDVSNETATIGALHGDELAQQLMNAQSAEIDGVAGATVTSDAVKKAAQDCINQAMGVENTVSAAETTAENPSWLGDAPDGYRGHRRRQCRCHVRFCGSRRRRNRFCHRVSGKGQHLLLWPA